jgi:hypothetical protein
MEKPSKTLYAIAGGCGPSGSGQFCESIEEVFEAAQNDGVMEVDSDTKLDIATYELKGVSTYKVATQAVLVNKGGKK